MIISLFIQIKKELSFYIFYMEGQAGFEPAMRELQSLALPLGYSPMH
jgi:hypothetical protein